MLLTVSTSSTPATQVRPGFYRLFLQRRHKFSFSCLATDFSTQRELFYYCQAILSCAICQEGQFHHYITASQVQSFVALLHLKHKYLVGSFVGWAVYPWNSQYQHNLKSSEDSENVQSSQKGLAGISRGNLPYYRTQRETLLLNTILYWTHHQMPVKVTLVYLFPHVLPYQEFITTRWRTTSASWSSVWTTCCRSTASTSISKTITSMSCKSRSQLDILIGAFFFKDCAR